MIHSQFERVEHLQADVPDVLFVFALSRHLLQNSSNGIINLLIILKFCSTAVQNPWNTHTCRFTPTTSNQVSVGTPGS